MPPTILCAQDDRNLYEIHERALIDQSVVQPLPTHFPDYASSGLGPRAAYLRDLFRSP